MTKELLFSNWSFVRILRLSLGIFVAYSAFKDQSLVFGFFSALLLFQAITNTGCCGANGCDVPVNKVDNDKTKTEDVSFEDLTETKK